MNLLLVRTSALGDVVHALPVLTAARRHFPEARIAWVVEEAFAPLLQGHRDLDRVLPVRLRAWRKRPFEAHTRREVIAFLRTLRAFRADVALDLMGNHKGGVLAALSGARRRIGPARHRRREPSSVLWITEGAEARGEHAVERALAVLERLDVPAGTADFGPERLVPDRRPGLEEGTADAGAGFVLLHPGAGWGNKVYPPERWGRVARGVADATGLAVRVALAPAPAERELAATVVATSAGAADAVEASDLPGLAELSRRARLVLGGDTGPVHLAHALGTPVLQVMGPTDPRRHGPYGAPERALARPLPCSYCYQRFAETKACLLEIPPGAVVERAAEILLHCPPDA